MTPLLFLKSICIVSAVLVNGDARCGRQAMQVCGKVSKFFGVEGNETWQNGIGTNRQLGCDDNVTTRTTEPPTAATCSKVFSEFGNATASVTVIGVASLSSWCNNSACSPLFFHAGKPVVVCHERGFNASACCVEPGQWPRANFTSLVPCLVTAASTTGAIVSTPSLPLAPTDDQRGLIAGAAVGGLVGFALLLALVVVAVRRSQIRAAPATMSASNSYGVLPGKQPPQYDDVRVVRSQPEYESPTSVLNA